MGKACTFFGHHDCPSSIKPKLREVLIDLIEKHAVDMFYVGQQGAFDGIVRSVLKELVLVYPHIRYAVILERMPPKRDEFDTRDYSDTMLPEGIETVHPRFAISWRNKWMLKQSDYRILREGKILSLKVGRAYRIPKAHLFTYLCIGCGETVNS